MSTIKSTINDVD